MNGYSEIRRMDLLTSNLVSEDLSLGSCKITQCSFRGSILLSYRFEEMNHLSLYLAAFLLNMLRIVSRACVRMSWRQCNTFQ